MSRPRAAADATEPAPGVSVRPPAAATRAVAVILHGGREHSLEPADPAHLAAVRMRPFAAAI
ncbi:MAG TPA: hypothetical protein VG708_15610, partial [Mycobacteriales bacterium]|nr:hypothetical protein [Mycobacteriales bacterium]